MGWYESFQGAMSTNQSILHVRSYHEHRFMQKSWSNLALQQFWNIQHNLYKPIYMHNLSIRSKIWLFVSLAGLLNSPATSDNKEAFLKKKKKNLSSFLNLLLNSVLNLLAKWKHPSPFQMVQILSFSSYQRGYAVSCSCPALNFILWLTRECLHDYQFNKKCILYPNTHFNLYLKHPKLGQRFEWIFHLKSLQKPAKVLQTWGHYLILLSVQRLQKKTKNQLKQFLNVDKKWQFFASCCTCLTQIGYGSGQRLKTLQQDVSVW